MPTRSALIDFGQLSEEHTYRDLKIERLRLLNRMYHFLASRLAKPSSLLLFS